MTLLKWHLASFEYFIIRKVRTDLLAYRLSCFACVAPLFFFFFFFFFFLGGRVVFFLVLFFFCSKGTILKSSIYIFGVLSEKPYSESLERNVVYIQKTSSHETSVASK